MTPMQYIKRLVLLAFIIKVTSHPTPCGRRLINFFDNGIGGNRRIGPTNYQDDRRYHQKNVETGSDSSLLEISFQPLRELESVLAPPQSSPSSSSWRYPLAEKQFLDEDPPARPLPPTSGSNLPIAISRNPRNFHRQRRTHHRSLSLQAEQRHNRQRYPDEFSNEGPTPAYSLAPHFNAPNEISYPDEDDTKSGPIGGPFDFMRRDLQNAGAASSTGEHFDGEDDEWNIFKRQRHPLSLGPTEGQQLFAYLNDDANNKRNALVAFKRQKLKSHQTQFIPSISVGAMTHLGDFFKNLKNNLEYMEKGRFSGTEEQLLEGDHPISMIKAELASDGIKPTGTAAFLHAIRTYRPSQRIRSLVALNPEGYHGSQFLDPNYMWVGLGKRK